MAFAESGIGPLSDPTRAVYGYVATVAPNAWITIPLLDAMGVAFAPTPANPFGIKDLIIKNVETVTCQIQFRQDTNIFLNFYCSPSADVKLSFEGMIPIYGTLQVRSSGGVAYVTVDGAQR